VRNRLLVSVGLGSASTFASVLVSTRGFTRLRSKIERLHEPWSHIPEMKPLSTSLALGGSVALGAAWGAGYAAAASVIPYRRDAVAAAYAVALPIGALVLARQVRSSLGLPNRSVREAFPVARTVSGLGVRAIRGALFAHTVERLRT
jgi:hypothetical protein